MIGFQQTPKCIRGGMVAVMLMASSGAARGEGNIFQATLAEPNQKSAEVSTEELRNLLANGAMVLDSRKRSEYLAGHIAGALAAAPEVGAPPSAFVATVERLVGGDRAVPLVLYCNGQFCQASRRLSEHLVAAGFTNVRRYQLGIPMWRALNGPVEIELDGIVRLFGVDRTAVYFDARNSEEFAKGSIAGAHNVTVEKFLSDGPEKSPLPHDDFNTRVILFGRDGAQARQLALALGKTPYQNVSYFPGTFDELKAALKAR